MLFSAGEIVAEQKIENARRFVGVLGHDADEPPGLGVHCGEPHHLRVVFAQALGALEIVFFLADPAEDISLFRLMKKKLVQYIAKH